MRCFRSTTALAAALALLAPATLRAESPLAPEAAAAMDAASRADMPTRAAQLDEELARGLGAEALSCLDGGARPCADGEALVTPGGLVVRLAQDDTIILAPRKAQQQQDGAKRKGKGADAEDAPAVAPAEAAASEAAPEPEQKPRKAEKAEEKAKARAERQAERKAARSAGDEAKAEATPDADALAAGLAAAGEAADAPIAPVALPEPAEPQPGKSDATDAQASAAAQEPPAGEPAMPDATRPNKKQRAQKQDTEAAPEATVAEPLGAGSEPIPAPLPEAGADAAARAGDTPVVAQPAPGGQAAPGAADLAAALAAAEKGKPAPDPVVQGTAAVTGQAEAPKPVVVDEAQTRSLEETLRKATEGRTSRAERRAQPAAPGASADATAAAAAGDAPVVDALNAPATISDNARAVVVTEGSARSASEDFGTRLTDGLTPAQQRRLERLQKQLAAQKSGDGNPVVVGDGSDASKDEDDDTRDLAGMLLAGVGGYVLANVLANNGQIALSSPDRVVVQQPDGSQSIIKDDNALLFQPGAQVTTEDFADGSSRTIVTRDDGSRVVTIRDANLRVLRRTLIAADGTVTDLIDDAAPVDPVVVADLPPPARSVDLSGQVNEDALRAALAREAAVDRRFTLNQIRSIPEVRGLVAPVEIDAITFDTGSAAIRPDQAQQLATLGKVISDYVRANPAEVFLIEGHTDTVGAAAMNLALSDRRAESVALALAQYFDVPPENMVVQGYGEQHLKVNQEGDVRVNRRAAVRRITDLLARS